MKIKLNKRQRKALGMIIGFTLIFSIPFILMPFIGIFIHDGGFGPMISKEVSLINIIVEHRNTRRGFSLDANLYAANGDIYTFPHTQDFKYPFQRFVNRYSIEPNKVGAAYALYVDNNNSYTQEFKMDQNQKVILTLATERGSRVIGITDADNGEIILDPSDTLAKDREGQVLLGVIPLFIFCILTFSWWQDLTFRSNRKRS